jgi:hypothetical protein
MSGAITVSFWGLGWRALWRDARAGELRLLILAVALAVAALSAVGFFADRLQGGLARDAKAMIGGDAVKELLSRIDVETESREIRLKIQEKEKIHTLKDLTRDELYTFVEGLTQDQFKKLEYWVDNFPSFVVTAEATCKKCGFLHRLEYSDFTTFFV